MPLLHIFTQKYGLKASFSNWYPSSFDAPHQSGGDISTSIRFFNSEQYMMWRKALLFGDEAIADEILTTTDAKAVKGLGRKVSGFDADVWNKNALVHLFYGFTA
jgi:ribA/ribD-fused uncharacterized protein